MLTIEQEEFKARMKALDENEKRRALMLMPDNLLYEEIERRNNIRREKLADIAKILKTND